MTRVSSLFLFDFIDFFNFKMVKYILAEVIMEIFSQVTDELINFWGLYGSKKTCEVFEKKVIECNSAKLSLWFVQNFEDADVKLHSKVILENGDYKDNYDFAHEIYLEPSGVDIKKHGKVVIESGNPLYNLEFAQLDGSDVKAHEKVILEKGGPQYNYEFAIAFPECDVKAHGKVIIDSGDLMYNYSYAFNVKGADVKEHEKVILNSKDLYYIYRFASIPGADVKAHGKVIIDSKNLEYNYFFTSIPGADVKAHAQVILDSKDAKYNYRVLECGKYIDADAHRKVIFDSGVEKYIELIYSPTKEYFENPDVFLMSREQSVMDKLDAFLEMNNKSKSKVKKKIK